MEKLELIEKLELAEHSYKQFDKRYLAAKLLRDEAKHALDQARKEIVEYLESNGVTEEKMQLGNH